MLFYLGLVAARPPVAFGRVAGYSFDVPVLAGLGLIYLDLILEIFFRQTQEASS